MRTLQTAWRYIKGLLAAVAVGFGTVGVILLIELSDAIPDTLSFIALPLGIAAVVYSAWRASRPAPIDAGIETEVHA